MSSTASDAGSAQPIVLIDGMWMTPLSWEHWAGRYRERGHQVHAPAWPGLDPRTGGATPRSVATSNLSIPDIVDHYDTIIRGLDQRPIIIGHSFGGLYTQLLLDRRLGAAGVALGTAAPKASWVAALHAEGRMARLGQPEEPAQGHPADAGEFHWCFTNSLSREDSEAVYQRYYIPGSGRPFFQAGYANFNPNAVTKVNYRNPNRAPLLLVTGTEDRICPPAVNRANFKKQRQAPTTTDSKEYPGRCHFPGRDGWEEVADFILSWTTDRANRSRTSPA